MSANNLSRNDDYSGKLITSLHSALNTYGKNVKIVYIRHVVGDGFYFEPLIDTNENHVLIVTTGVSNCLRFIDDIAFVFFDKYLREFLQSLTVI